MLMVLEGHVGGRTGIGIKENATAEESKRLAKDRRSL